MMQAGDASGPLHNEMGICGKLNFAGRFEILEATPFAGTKTKAIRTVADGRIAEG